MNIDNVKKIVELLLIKQYNFVISPDEILMLNELQYLLNIYHSNLLANNDVECNCALNHETIKIEIDNNKCFNCGLPIAVS